MMLCCLLLLTSAGSANSERRDAFRGQAFLLFSNNETDNNEKEVTLFRKENSSILIGMWTWKNGPIEGYINPEYNTKCDMDRSKNIWFWKVDINDSAKYCIKCNGQDKGIEVELNVLEKLTGEQIGQEIQKWLGDHSESFKKYFGKLTAEQDGQEIRKWLDDRPEFLKKHLGSSHLPSEISTSSYWTMALQLVTFLMLTLYIIFDKKSDISKRLNSWRNLIIARLPSHQWRQEPSLKDKDTIVLNIEEQEKLTEDQIGEQIQKWLGVYPGLCFIKKYQFGVPQQVQVTSHRDSPNPTSYLLMWNRPDDEGSLLQKYSLRYQEVEIVPRRTEYELSRPLSETVCVDILPSAVSYTLSPLKPGRYYQVEIQAINTQGQSSLKHFIFKTRECVPQPVHVISHRDSPNQTSYLLKWEKPDDGGSPLLKYIITYQKVEIIPKRTVYELSRPLSEFISVDNILPSTVSYTLSPLMPGRYYQVEIQAINTQGQSLPQNFIFKTKEGVPPAVQVTSHCNSPNPTSYLLTWNKPDDEGSLPQKYILKYRNVEIISNKAEYELSRPLSEFISVDNIPPSTLCCRLTPLMPGRYYQVEIQAENTQGQSAPQSFIFRTKESTPKRIDNEVQTDLQLPVQQTSYVPGTNKTMQRREDIAHPTEETNSQSPTDVKFSEKIQLLQPRENTEHSADIHNKPGCSVMQLVSRNEQNPEEDKGQIESVESTAESDKEDSGSDDESNMPLLSINPKKSKDSL